MSYNQSSLPHCLLLPCLPIPPKDEHVQLHICSVSGQDPRLLCFVPPPLRLPLVLHRLLTQKVMWRRSGSNKPAAPSLVNPAWETRGCAPRSFCGAGRCRLCRGDVLHHRTRHRKEPSFLWSVEEKTTVKPAALSARLCANAASFDLKRILLLRFTLLIYYFF